MKFNANEIISYTAFDFSTLVVNPTDLISNWIRQKQTNLFGQLLNAPQQSHGVTTYLETLIAPQSKACVFVNKLTADSVKLATELNFTVFIADDCFNLQKHLIFAYLLCKFSPIAVLYRDFGYQDALDLEAAKFNIRDFLKNHADPSKEETIEIAKQEGIFSPDYSKDQILTKIVKSRAEHEFLKSIVRTELDIFDGDDCAVSFGQLLSEIQKLETLIFNAKAASNSIKVSVDNRKLLKSWLKAYENKDFNNLPNISFRSSPGKEFDFLFKNQHLFQYKTRWLIDNGSILDVNNNLIHSILASNENIKLLIVDSNPFNGNEQYKNRRDIGLYCMNYGNSYTASICPQYSYSQAATALKEADAFDGPSIVISHQPDSISALDSLKISKDIIDAGIISLYRWKPNTLGDPILNIDSTKAKATLQKFMRKQETLTMLIEKSNQSDPTLVKNMDDLLLEKAKKSYQALFGSLNSKKLLVLFGSDGGNAEALAKRLGLEAKEKGLFVKTMAMDDYAIENIVEEENVLFVVSTAGQGEFPGNSRESWKHLNSNDLDLSKVKYSVLALGDRHYWPRPEDAHYFAKAGKDLDKRLKDLGAKELTNIGIGDDRDPDGYLTGVSAWAAGFWESLGVEVESVNTGSTVPTDDAIKSASNYLRGTIAEGLLDESTGKLAEYDTKLTKFHGIYQQDDRDVREHRARMGMENAYSFMIRVRVPGGVCTPSQYLAMDDISENWANKTIKVTTRQAFQFHGVLKSVLKRTIQDINKSLLDTIAACGDVNRNVMCNPNELNSKIHERVQKFSRDLSSHLTPATTAYHEIWLDKKLVAGGDFEPLYGKTYLPRKFKIAIAVPPSNDVDCFAHDLGYIAIVEGGDLKGFNVIVGGGMGSTHGNAKTYPTLGKQLGFCTLEQAIDVGEKVMLVQRDYGDRLNRKHARLRYTIEDRGLDWFRTEVEARLGYKLGAPKPFKFTSNGDVYGWNKNTDGTWSYTMFIQNGRIKDTSDFLLKTGLREIAKIHKGEFALTPNQNLIISKVSEYEKPAIIQLLDKYKIRNENLSLLRLNSMACVALPTCALAMAESERYLPELITKIELLLENNGLQNDAITIRMTGCPNGCARPWIAEIAFIGKAPGTYNMYLGGGFTGERLNKLYRESVDEAEILKLLEPIIKEYSITRYPGEKFGDYIVRKNIVSK